MNQRDDATSVREVIERAKALGSLSGTALETWLLLAYEAGRAQRSETAAPEGEPGSAFDALGSAIESHRNGDLEEWELQLVRRRMEQEEAQRSAIEPKVYQCPRCATSMEVDPTAKPSAARRGRVGCKCKGAAAESCQWPNCIEGQRP